MEEIREKIGELSTINTYIVPTIQCDDVPPFDDIKRGKEIVNYLFEAFKDKTIKFPSQEKRTASWEKFIEEKKAFNYNCSERFRIWKDYSETRRKDLLGDLGPLFFDQFVDDIFFFDKMTKEKMIECGQDLKEINQRVKEMGSKLTKDDRAIVINRIIEVRQSHNVFWERYKQAHNENFLERKKEKNKEFLEGLNDKDRNFLEKLEARKEKIEANIDKLRDMKADAKGDSFREKVSEWIEENEEQLESVKDKISKVRDQIYDRELEIRDM